MYEGTKGLGTELLLQLILLKLSRNEHHELEKGKKKQLVKTVGK